MRTRDALGIFWDGEEVEGALFYGLWAGERLTTPRFPVDLWPSTTEVRPRRLWGEGWTVWLWEVRIRSWPAEDDWRRAVSGTLEELLSAGAGISWCAVEGCFLDPPNLFDPVSMGECLWGCQSNGGISVPVPALEGNFNYVSNGILADLRSEAMNLLNGTGHG